jgi:[ribosomal protein S5]-alanine N-acetyltransferase
LKRRRKTRKYLKWELNLFLITERLIIKPLALTDVSFILELLNSEGWIKFIGNRNVTSQVEASTYIERILENKNIVYWVVKLRDSQVPVGIVTFIKRDYLEHHDIGFAFLPNFAKKGYAYEATNAVLQQLIRERNITHILAITVPENMKSIKLLKKIGLAFEKEIELANGKVDVYGLQPIN